MEGNNKLGLILVLVLVEAGLGYLGVYTLGARAMNALIGSAPGATATTSNLYVQSIVAMDSTFFTYYVGGIVALLLGVAFTLAYIQANGKAYANA